MKMVVFAQSPPPIHGQSVMVAQMLGQLGGDWRGKQDRAESQVPANQTQSFHVNARLSDDLADIGSVRIGKIARLIRYVIEAIWCRFYYSATTLYYVPAPPKRSAFYRDCVVMALCRPFFSRVIFHWHAIGLCNWLAKEASPWARWLGRRLLGRPDLSISLASSLESDASYLHSKRMCVVPNGIPDPCPDFDVSVLPIRRERLEARRKLLTNQNAHPAEMIYSVLFLGHCLREKGLFDALEAIRLANCELEERRFRIRMRLTIAGEFPRDIERAEFEAWLARHPADTVYSGFADAEGKARLLRDCDCLCFPSYYPAEGQPLVLLEAMAFGLSIVATDWRAIPDTLPSGFHTCPIHDPQSIAKLLSASLLWDSSEHMRRHFTEQFSVQRFGENIRAALTSLQSRS